MENASKALIIAGAILISILIIGLGVYFYNVAANAGKTQSLDPQVAEAHNQQFTSYFGDRKSSTDVKNLMSLVRSNNITGNTAAETQNITILFKGGNVSALAITSPASVQSQVKPGKTYWIGVKNDDAASDDSQNVTLNENAEKTAAYYSNGYLRVITITENAGK